MREVVPQNVVPQRFGGQLQVLVPHQHPSRQRADVEPGAGGLRLLAGIPLVPGCGWQRRVNGLPVLFVGRTVRGLHYTLAEDRLKRHALPEAIAGRSCADIVIVLEREQASASRCRWRNYSVVREGLSKKSRVTATHVLAKELRAARVGTFEEISK